MRRRRRDWWFGVGRDCSGCDGGVEKARREGGKCDNGDRRDEGKKRRREERKVDGGYLVVVIFACKIGIQLIGWCGSIAFSWMNVKII